jgi:hypothetical protein
VENKNDTEKEKLKKLCLNCAWRVACGKRFSVSYVNGDVNCIDYSFDMTLKHKDV